MGGGPVFVTVRELVGRPSTLLSAALILVAPLPHSGTATIVSSRAGSEHSANAEAPSGKQGSAEL